MDRISPEARSANMKAVRRKDTAPELFVRRMLHAAGYRYRLHRKELPGCPDIVFVSKKRAIFVHGCFWHGHDCRAGRPPQSRQEYWLPKIARNRERDVAAVNSLISSGWKIHVVWECELADGTDVMNRLKQFIDS
ncbi:very short patch repair endonuclease [Methylosinus sporium]|uniref:very short patch repair endonuclease n=1 Tax=Methylosinus sporium TaxID=428 RepID=UPI000D58C862|nr:very short patch repair endonuclease [Methylosinus sporium]PWB88481.1 very short patch repair endonuclease [Methylocystis sp. MitZ-2018]